MRLELDDAQQSRHGFGQMADNVGILLDEFKRAGVPDSLAHELAKVWWTVTINSALGPNLADIFKGMTEGGE